MTPLNPALIWNGWTRNYVYREEGYIIHGFLETKGRNGPTRSLCGVRIYDSGLLNLKDKEFEPGCIRCRRILRKNGLGKYLSFMEKAPKKYALRPLREEWL